jgi:hypothetical protein
MRTALVPLGRGGQLVIEPGEEEVAQCQRRDHPDDHADERDEHQGRHDQTSGERPRNPTSQSDRVVRGSGVRWSA